MWSFHAIAQNTKRKSDNVMTMVVIPKAYNGTEIPHRVVCALEVMFQAQVQVMPIGRFYGDNKSVLG